MFFERDPAFRTPRKMGHPKFEIYFLFDLSFKDATRPDEEETKRSSLFGNFNFVYFKTVAGMLDGVSECIIL